MFSNENILLLIIAIGGWSVAIIQFIVSLVERYFQRKRELLLTAFSYFTGGSQKRSIGISIIEGLWTKKEKYSEFLVPLLSNQIVYVLLHSKQGNSRHEFHNYLRMIGLIMKVKNIKSKYYDSYGEIRNALDLKLESKENRGIEVTSITIKAWIDKLDEL